MIIFSPEYLEYTLLGIILLPGLIFSIYTTTKVNTTFNKYTTVLSSKGLTGAEVARKILESQGIYNVEIAKINSSDLEDHFDPTSNVVSLSKRVYESTSISSIAVAAHEVGHAIQYATNYAPMKIRTIFAKASNIMSMFVWPLIVLGIILDFAYVGGIIGKAFLWAGVGFFGVSLIFSLITLPVERDASRRALKLMVETGCLDEMEVKGAKKVLSAAAMTYVAAIVVSVLELLRFVLFFLLNSRRD